jgi:hypothetical protein
MLLLLLPHAIDEKQEREWREACAESSGSEEWLTPACA